MLLLWIVLGLFVVCVVAGTWLVVVRTREALRTFRALGGAVFAAIDDVARRADALGTRTFDTERLERSLARLAASRARLTVLLGAFADVRASVGRVRAVVPRK